MRNLLFQFNLNGSLSLQPRTLSPLAPDLGYIGCRDYLEEHFTGCALVSPGCHP